MIARGSLRGGPGRGRRSTTALRHGPTIRRSSAHTGRTRAVAFFVLLATTLAIYGAATSSAFGFQRLDISGDQYTGEDLVRSSVGVAPGQNLFALGTDQIADRLVQLTTVVGATVEVALPGTLRVRLTERMPIVIWQVGDTRLLVDAAGVAFSDAPPTSNLPVVDDRRPDTDWLSVGSRIDPIEFDAASRLASLRPADVGSGAAALHVSIDERGFALDSGEGGWTALFGLYGPTVRQTGLVPGQVRLLHSLIDGREPTLASVMLADDRNGTYTLKTTP